MRTVRELLMLWDWALVTTDLPTEAKSREESERGGPGAIVSSAHGKPGDPQQVHRVLNFRKHFPPALLSSEAKRTVAARQPGVLTGSWDTLLAAGVIPTGLFLPQSGPSWGEDRPNGEGVGSSSLPR